jgi:glycosyltransferase involved in cell wall biosynthesis
VHCRIFIVFVAVFNRNPPSISEREQTYIKVVTPKFSIITPSYKQLEWLKLCAASIADQEGVTFEHIVQDAGTGPEVEAWAAGQPFLKLYVEKDSGMYDAINRGLRRGNGEILAYINCDEQYLPGALARVSQFFSGHPEIDVLFAHAVVVNESGQFIAYRKAILPGKYHTWVSKNIAILTCATFFRRRVLDQDGFFFNPNLKDVSDAEWIIRMLDRRLRMAVLPIFTSTFAETKENRNLAPNALREKKEIVASAPAWAQMLRSEIIAYYRLRRVVAGAYWQKPFDYAIYTLHNPSVRTTFRVDRPTYRWRR